MSKWRGGITGLVMLLITAVSIEGLLRVTDPLGAIRYDNDLGRQLAAFVSSERGFVMYPGLYQFSNWSALIQMDNHRHTPATKNADCRIAFVGDSLTWGFGVADADTSANLIAGDIEAQVVNAALSLYNSENVWRTVETLPADGYVYVVISNDTEITVEKSNIYPTTAPDILAKRTAAEVYFDLVFKQRSTPQIDQARFERDIEALAARDDVLIVVFDSAWYQRVIQLAPDAIVLPNYTARISAADPHPNAVGHAQIAANLLPYVREFESEVCG